MTLGVSNQITLISPYLVRISFTCGLIFFSKQREKSLCALSGKSQLFVQLEPAFL